MVLVLFLLSFPLTLLSLRLRLSPQLSNGQVDLVLSPSESVPGWFINYTALSRLAESQLGPDYSYSTPRWSLTANAYPLACTQLAAGARL